MRLGVFGANAAIYFFSSVANSLVPFALLPILTRALGPEEYGYVALFTIVCAGASAIVGMGVGGAFTRQYYHLEHGEFAVFAGTSILIVAGFTIISSVLAVPVSQYFSESLPLPASWISYAIISAGASAICNAWLAFTQVQCRALHYGAFQILMTLVNVGLSLLLVIGYGLEGQGRVMGQMVAVLIFSFVATYSLWRSGWMVFTIDRKHLRWLLFFGLPIVIHSISSVVISMSDRVVLARLEGAFAVGVYAVAVQLAMVMTLLVDSVNKAYVPWLYSRLALDCQKIKLRLVRASYLYFSLVLLLASILSLVVPDLVIFIAGEQYLDAAQYLSWLFFAGAFTGMYYMVGLYINYSANNKYLSYASGLAAIVTPVACYFFVLNNGALGAAQGAMVGQVTLFFATWFFSKRAYCMPWFGK